MSRTQKPLLLKDFLELDPHSDSSNSFFPFPRKPQPPTVRFLLEADGRRSAASFRHSASISGGGAFTKLINAVKKFPLSSSTRPSEEGLLMRSISRKLNKRFWKRKDKEGRRVTTVKDIVRLDSFELYGERRSLCFPSPVVSSCCSCSDDGGEGSESSVSSSSSGELDCFPREKSRESPSRNRSPLLSSSMEGENQGVEYKGCLSEEEKEQLSPISIMDFPCQYEDDEGEGEGEEARSSGFERNLANIEKSTHELLEKITRFETLAELVDPLDLDLRFSSSDDECDLHVASLENITAKHLIQRLRSNFEVDRQAEKLLVDFFSETPSLSTGTASADTERLLSAAGNWINGVGCLKAEEQGKVHLSEMERNARWRGFDDGKDDVAADVEAILLGSLLHELVLELANAV